MLFRRLHLVIIVAWASAVQAQAPVYGLDNPDAIPGRYMVKMRSGVNGMLLYDSYHNFPAQSFADQHQVGIRSDGSQIITVFSSGEDVSVQGFAAQLSDSALDDLRNNPDVEFVEVDRKYYLSGIISESGSNVINQGLYRIGRTEPTGNDAYIWDDAAAGQDVDIYIVDTGIRISHRDFQGRANIGISNNAIMI
jgi:subtilisin family serine protease